MKKFYEPEYVWYVFFRGQKFGYYFGIYSDLHTAIETAKDFVVNEDAKLVTAFQMIEPAKDRECYVATGKTLFNASFKCYIQRVEINMPIEEP